MPVGDNSLVNMSQPSVSRCISSISELIVMNMAKYVRFPGNHREIEIKKEGFREKGMPDVIGIVDGTHIPIIAPPKTDLEHHPRHFRSHKRFYSINVEAVCDSSLQFLAVNAKYPGACHDANIWASSLVRRYLQQHWMAEQPMYLLGDMGYPLEPWLLTPYTDPVEEHEISFNARQVPTRKHIERAFGILKNTFRCLNSSRKLQYHPIRAANIIYSCFILYNFMRAHNFPMVEDDILAEEFEERAHGHIEITLARSIRDNYARNLI